MKLGFFLDKDVDQTLLAVILLPFLFSPIPLKRKLNDSKKLGKGDAYRFFSSHFQVRIQSVIYNSYFIEKQLFQNDEALRTFDTKLTSSAKDPLPPRAYVIGCLKQDPTAVIKVADQSYPIDNPLLCADILFKIILSMKLQFPRHSLSVWNFVEKFFYDLNITKNSNSQILAKDVVIEYCKEDDFTLCLGKILFLIEVEASIKVVYKLLTNVQICDDLDCYQVKNESNELHVISLENIDLSRLSYIYYSVNGNFVNLSCN